MGAFYRRGTAQEARPARGLVLAQTQKILPSRMLGYPQYALPNSSCLAAFADTSSRIR
jgi:hypothetical protein